MTQLGVQHRPRMPDSRAVYLWPSAKVRDSGLEEASPVGCPSASWPPVGGQVSPNLRLRGSKQVWVKAAFCTNFSGFWGLGFCCFPALWKCLMTTQDSSRRLFQGPRIPALMELPLPPESWQGRLRALTSLNTCQAPGVLPRQ